MKSPKQLLYREREAFNQLDFNGKRLILATLVYNIINPIFNLFASAFVLRQSQDIQLVALYNLCAYVGLPIGFYINGWLLRKFKPNQMYLLGASMQATVISLLIFLSATSYLEIIGFGLAVGISAGVFWSNRNFLLFKVTRSDNRIYYTGLDLTISTINGIIIPILIGTFIVWGTTHSLYDPIQAYYAIALSTFIFIILLGFIMKDILVEKPIIRHIFVRKPVPHWNKIRATNFTLGIFQGTVNFFPTLLVFTFIGNEDALGTIQSISALLSAIIVYTIGKKVEPQKRIWMVTFGVAMLISGALFLSSTFNNVGIFTYLAIQSLAMPLLFIATGSLILDRMDQDESGSGYPYVFDNELTLNIGRIIGITGFLAMINIFSKNEALRMTPLILTSLQIFLFLLVKILEGKSVRLVTKRYLSYVTTLFSRNG